MGGTLCAISFTGAHRRGASLITWLHLFAEILLIKLDSTTLLVCGYDQLDEPLPGGPRILRKLTIINKTSFRLRRETVRRCGAAMTLLAELRRVLMGEETSTNKLICYAIRSAREVTEPGRGCTQLGVDWAGVNVLQ